MNKVNLESLSCITDLQLLIMAQNRTCRGCFISNDRLLKATSPVQRNHNHSDKRSELEINQNLTCRAPWPLCWLWPSSSVCLCPLCPPVSCWIVLRCPQGEEAHQIIFHSFWSHCCHSDNIDVSENYLYSQRLSWFSGVFPSLVNYKLRKEMHICWMVHTCPNYTGLFLPSLPVSASVRSCSMSHFSTRCPAGCSAMCNCNTNPQFWVRVSFIHIHTRGSVGLDPA